MLDHYQKVVPNGLGLGFNEGFFVGDHVFMLDGCKNSHFINSVFFFLLREMMKLNFLEGIRLPIFQPSYFVDLTISSIP